MSLLPPLLVLCYTWYRFKHQHGATSLTSATRYLISGTSFFFQTHNRTIRSANLQMGSLKVCFFRELILELRQVGVWECKERWSSYNCAKLLFKMDKLLHVYGCEYYPKLWLSSCILLMKFSVLVSS